MVEIAYVRMCEKEKLFWKKVGEHIFEKRKQAGLTQHQFAALMRVSRASIANMECGRQAINLYRMSIIEDILEANKK